MRYDDFETLIIQGKRDELHSKFNDRNINMRASNGSTLLHTAVMADKPEIVTVLIDRGIETNAQDDVGKTPLHRALELERDNIAELLITHGASTTVEDNYGGQPLLDAVRNAGGDYELVELLLERGADPHHQNDYRVSPLSMARTTGDTTLIELLKSYADD